MHHRLFFLAAGLFAAVLVAVAAAQEKKPTPTEWLESQGLKRLSSQFVLPEEAEFSKLLRQAGDVQKSLGDAQSKLDALEQQKRDAEKLIFQYLQQRRQLRVQLNATTSVSAHNRIVTALNELGDRIVLLQQAGQDETPLREARALVSKLSEEYIELVLQARTMHDAIRARYAELTANAVVGRAIARVNESSERTYSLGPSSSLEANSRKLAKMEQAVLSESIALRRGASGLWFVSVMLNGKHAQEMAIDTGASIVVLPFEVAQQANLPTAVDPDNVLTLTLGDGSQVQAARVMADSVRVGKFTVENVECAILPPNLPRSMPLLGQTYLQNFAYKIDSASGKLIMNKVQSDDSPRGRR